MSEINPNHPRLRADDIVSLLKGKYPSGAYAFLEQVCDGTGARANRWADAVAMSVWPSRGYDITGFEVKVSRYDWQKELINPAKAEQIMQYCHYWYLVVGDEKIVQPGELPSTWGLMAVVGEKLKTIIAAPYQKPKAADIPFIASVLRNFQRTEVGKIEQLLLEERNKEAKRLRDHNAEALAKLNRSIEQFETRSGIKIDAWDGPQLGSLLGAVQRMQWDVERLAASRASAQKIVDGLDGLLALTGVVEIVDALKSTQKTEEQ